jgi:hypothetical protein
LQALFDPFPSDTGAATAAMAAAARINKDGSRQRPRDAMTKGLRRAEITTPSPGDPGLIGWGPRKPAGTLEPPGQPRALEAIRRSADRVFLDWKEPADGGKAAACQAARRELPDGPWQPAGTCVISEATPGNQPPPASTRKTASSPRKKPAPGRRAIRWRWLLRGGVYSVSPGPAGSGPWTAGSVAA